MKWFKHDSDAGNDAKLRKLRIKYGAQGYGIYWYCLELIARNVEKHNLTFELEHDAELIADDFKLNGEFVQEMMAYMVNLGLFENTQGVITCLKMSTRTDEYTQQLMRDVKKTPERLPTLPLDPPDNVRGIRREEKRREERDAPTVSSIEERQNRVADSCLALRNAGVLDFTSINPSFIKLIDLGVTAEEFEDCAKSSKIKKFSYIVQAVAGRREDASNLTLAEKSKAEPDWKKGML